MKNETLVNEIKSCFRKRMSYRETREYVISLNKYEVQTVIMTLQKLFIERKIRTSKRFLLFGLFYVSFRLMEWRLEGNFELRALEYRYYLVGAIGAIIIGSSLISLNWAKRNARSTMQ